MPKHYAVGLNVQTGTVTFNNSKTRKITFDNPFNHSPSVTLTLADNNASPPYKKKASKTKLEIKFKNKFSGEVDWIAMEN